MAATERLDELVSIVQVAAEEQGVAFLASDVDADGGKLILAAGAPSHHGRRRGTDAADPPRRSSTPSRRSRSGSA